MSRRRALASSLTLVSLTLVVGCTSDDDGSSDAAEPLTFVVDQDPPILTDVDLQQSGTTVGDLLFFEAPITDDDGNVGELLGTLATAQIPGADSQVIEERLGNLVFSFGDDTLVVLGATEYPSEQQEMAASSPQIRAVVGGTGRFIGARGEVVSERRDDGTYTHTFTLLDVTSD